MSGSRISRSAVAGATLLLVVVGLLAAAPAQADPESHNSWNSREDAIAPGTGTDYSWAGPDNGLQLASWDGLVTVYTNPSQGQSLSVTFVPPAGQTLEAGGTYRADAWPEQPTSTTTGRMVAWHDDTMCGRDENQLFGWPSLTNPATGTFHISELEYDGDGNVTRFAATYELNCQYVDGPAGVEGSVAVNATAPAAPVPDVPVTPGPVTDLTAKNVGPDGGGVNSTTLSWHNPAGFGDVNIDMVQSENPANLRSVIAHPWDQQYRGRATSHRDNQVDFMDTRTYRVVPRGTTGRLGPATLLTVIGTRLSVPAAFKKITIGQQVTYTGRLSLAWDYVDPADVMKGPGLVGRTVVLCTQSSVHYVDGVCTAVDRTTTTADGHFSLSAKPKENTLYSVMVPATSRMLGNIDRVINADVAPQADLSAPESEQSSARASVRRGAVIHFSTSRARTGSRGVIRLQRLNGHTWKTIATKRLPRTGHARRLAVPYRERLRGRHDYRVLKPGDAHHVNGYSRTVHVRVR